MGSPQRSKRTTAELKLKKKTSNTSPSDDEPQPSMNGIARGSKLKSTKPLRHLMSSKSSSKLDMISCLYCCELLQQKSAEIYQMWISKAWAHEGCAWYNSDAFTCEMCAGESDLLTLASRSLKTRCWVISSDTHCKQNVKTNSYRITG